jgi:hypothetical protein
MKTIKIQFVLGLLIILFYSCQQKSSNDSATNKSDSLSVKPTNEYAIMLDNGLYKLLRIYYGNNKSEDYPISNKATAADTWKNGEDLWSILNTNDVVNALNYMTKKGWELKNSYSMDNGGTLVFIFKK